MSSKIRLLDCTLRDGAYIVNSMFGDNSIRGILSKLSKARIDVIEMGWLKNDPHKANSSYFHNQSDILPYIENKDSNSLYCVMIDWDRYDVSALEKCDGKSLDGIRVVFPHGKYKEGIEIGKKIREKGYKVFFQLANTLAYSESDLIEVSTAMNDFNPECLYMVDTFGAMYDDDVEKIARILDKNVDKKIKLGIHTHNNQQLALSNTIKFIEVLKDSDREIIVDASLSGMGRGAGNATTELLATYLNRKCNAHYNLDDIMDAIDIYMTYYSENFEWGYSTPYAIAGIYCCHVNNIAYLLENHRTNAKDMRSIVESMDELARRKYDYDYLENKYITNANYKIDDNAAISDIKKLINGREVLFIAPGKSVLEKKDEILSYIKEKKPFVLGVNSIIKDYIGYYDAVLFVNPQRYEYAKNAYGDEFNKIKKILTSNVKNESKDELIICFNNVAKKGYKYFDNAVILGLNIMDYIGEINITLAGFDGFKNRYNESYADEFLPSLNPNNDWESLNVAIKDVYKDFILRAKNVKNIKYLTKSIFEA